MSNSENTQDFARNLATVQINSKSPGVAAILVLLFGGLGFFYVSILGGVLASLGAIVIAFLTFGLGLIFYHPILVIVAIVLVNRHNKSLLAKTFDN